MTGTGSSTTAAKTGDRAVKPRMNRALVDLVDKWCRAERPDVIFTYLSGELVWPETVQAMRSQGIPIVNLCLNDKENFVGKIRGGRAFGMRDICRHFDLCWTSTEDALKKYCVEGALPLYLPEGANPRFTGPMTSSAPSTWPSWDSATATGPRSSGSCRKAASAPRPSGSAGRTGRSRRMKW